MTKKEKLISAYVTEHIDTIGLETVTSLSRNIGVSDATVIRFVRDIGYDSFSDFKKQMNSRMLKQYNSALSANELYKKTMCSLNEDSLITDLLECTYQNLRDVALKLDMKKLEEAVKLIMHSRNKFIVGFRGGASCASFLARKLIYLTSQVTLCDSAESMTIEKIFDISTEDCVVLYSFQRYSEIVYPMLDIIQKNQAHIIVISDDQEYPPAPWADIIIPVSVKGLGFVNSYIAPLYLTELILLLASKYPNINKRIETLDGFINQTKLY